jgi:2-amino-4-hydroxy-6-hydroxymethyldihydropteridine diphosphokinase
MREQDPVRHPDMRWSDRAATLEKAYISGGSNLGDREANLEFALRSLGKGGTVSRVSSYFETEPVGLLDQPWFLNIAIELLTPLNPRNLLTFCLGIEDSCGRTRTFPNAPRSLDLDILLYGESVLREEDLIIPHPRLPERKFVLIPLAEIAPEALHPVLGKSIRTLLEACSDRSEVRIFRR